MWHGIASGTDTIERELKRKNIDQIFVLYNRCVFEDMPLLTAEVPIVDRMAATNYNELQLWQTNSYKITDFRPNTTVINKNDVHDTVSIRPFSHAPTTAANNEKHSADT